MSDISEKKNIYLDFKILPFVSLASPVKSWQFHHTARPMNAEFPGTQCIWDAAI